MDEKPVALLHGERQVGEESLLRGRRDASAVQSIACLRLGHHSLARVADGGIVIAAHDHCAGSTIVATRSTTQAGSAP